MVQPTFSWASVRAENGPAQAVLRSLMDEARRVGQPLALGALRGSRSNAFYRRHGWRLVGESEWDLHYRWP